MILPVTPVNVNPLKTTVIVNVPSTEHETRNSAFYPDNVCMCSHDFD